MSIAVLPLTDLSPDKNLEYLGDGLAEELIHGLAQLPEISVVSRTSSFLFKEQALDVQQIGAQLNVDTVLEGSIRQDEETLRITLQLIDVDNGFHIWSQQYDRGMSELFSIQEDITRNVVDAITPQNSSSNSISIAGIGTTNPLAYEAFLVARHETRQPTPEAVDRAIAQYRIAINHDPKFYRAYVELIRAYDFKGARFGNRDQEIQIAREVFEVAKANIPDPSPSSWFWVEQFFFYGHDIYQNIPESEELYSLMIRERAHPANEGSPIQGFFQYGIMLARSGFFRAALEFTLPLEAREPLHRGVKLRIAEYYAALGDYESSLGKYDELLALDPYRRSALFDKFYILGKLGRLDEAEIVSQQLSELFTPELTLMLEGTLEYWRGNADTAKAMLDEVANSDQIPASYKGVSYIVIQEFDLGLEYLHLAAEQLDGFISEIILSQTRFLHEEQWERLRSIESFQRLIERFGYSEQWPNELVRRANSLTRYTNVSVTNELTVLSN